MGIGTRTAGQALRARRPGQAIIEFALVLPLLLMLVFGICDFGIFMFRQMQAGNCARDVARRAAVRVPFATLATTGQCGGYNVSFAENGTNVTSYAGLAPGDSITVTARWNGDAWVIIDTFFPIGTITTDEITASVTMRMEGTRAT
jgi:Flp pilus assembly protein TadG